MRIALISDLHLDFWYEDDYLEEALDKQISQCDALGVDRIVIAGDFSNGRCIEETIDPGLYEAEIITCLGNHDHYGFPMPNDISKVGDDYIAATLWTNFHGSNGAEQLIYQRIADSKWIIGSNAWDLMNRFDETLQDIKKFDREIVITHFPPSRRSISERHQGNILNSYFVNDLDGLFNYGALNTKLWLCGHTHNRHAYRLGDCLVAANPLGYPGESYREIEEYRPMVLERKDGIWDISE